MKNNHSKLIYIAGYSRCGSTVLSMLLGSHHNVCSVGEVCFLPDDWIQPTRICTCGEPYSRCAFWSGLEKSIAFNEQVVSLVRQFDMRRAYEKTKAHVVTAADALEYGRLMRGVFDHARARSGAEVIVDSSKSARAAAARPIALRRFAQQDVYVIHLVRDGHATVDSYKRQGSNWVKEGYGKPLAFQTYRAMLGWRLANQYAGRLQHDLGTDRYLKIAYDDLVAEPFSTLETIGNFVGLDFADTMVRIERDEAFESDHQVGGNRVRFEAPRFKRKEKGVGEVRLPLVERTAFRLLAGRP